MTKDINSQGSIFILRHLKCYVSGNQFSKLRLFLLIFIPFDGFLKNYVLWNLCHLTRFSGKQIVLTYGWYLRVRRKVVYKIPCRRARLAWRMYKPCALGRVRAKVTCMQVDRICFIRKQLLMRRVSVSYCVISRGGFQMITVDKF